MDLIGYDGTKLDKLANLGYSFEPLQIQLDPCMIIWAEDPRKSNSYKYARFILNIYNYWIIYYSKYSDTSIIKNPLYIIRRISWIILMHHKTSYIIVIIIYMGHGLSSLSMLMTWLLPMWAWSSDIRCPSIHKIQCGKIHEWLMCRSRGPWCKPLEDQQKGSNKKVTSF